MNRQTTQEGSETLEEGKTDNIHELMEDLITLQEEQEKEVSDDKSTAFLGNKELDYLRQKQSLTEMIRSEVRKLGVDEQTWEESNLRNKLMREMKFLTQTSKSKGGVAMKLLKTKKVEQNQKLFEKRASNEDGKGVLDKLLGATDRAEAGSSSLNSDYTSEEKDTW